MIWLMLTWCHISRKGQKISCKKPNSCRWTINALVTYWPFYFSHTTLHKLTKKQNDQRWRSWHWHGRGYGCQLLGKIIKKIVQIRKWINAKKCLTNGSPYHLPCAHKKKKWQTKPLMNNDDWNTKKSKGYKKNKQRRKVGTTSLSLFKVHGK